MTIGTSYEVLAALIAVKNIDVEGLGDGLGEIKFAQSFISALVPGAIAEEPTNEMIAYAGYALIGEIVELIDELGWKKWKENPEITPKRKADIAEEFADILAFLGQLMVLVELRSGCTPQDIAAAYKRKSEKNVSRFTGDTDEAGYNGVHDSD